MEGLFKPNTFPTTSLTLFHVILAPFAIWFPKCDKSGISLPLAIAPPPNIPAAIAGRNLNAGANAYPCNGVLAGTFQLIFSNWILSGIEAWVFKDGVYPKIDLSLSP